MKVNEIINEELGFGDGFGGHDEDYARRKEEEHTLDELRKEFEDENTPLDDFEIDDIKRIVMPATRNNPQIKRQAEDILAIWKELKDDDAQVEDDIYNKVIPQYEKLKDSEETNIVKFNKMRALTKQIKDAATTFDEVATGERRDQKSDELGYFGK
jgi:hypothetical protein